MIDRYGEIHDPMFYEGYVEKKEDGEYVLYEDMVELLATLGYNIEDLS